MNVCIFLFTFFVFYQKKCAKTTDSPISGCTCCHHNMYNILKVGNFPTDFDPYELCTQTLHTKIFTQHGKFEKILWRDNDFFTTFDKYYFALKRLKTQEFWQNTNVFGFKTAESCEDAQNLPDVTISKALIGQIFPRR